LDASPFETLLEIPGGSKPINQCAGHSWASGPQAVPPFTIMAGVWCSARQIANSAIGLN
jgi:hypothetical protein